MKNTFLFCLVLASLAAFAQMAPFDEKIESAPEESEDVGTWTTYETDVDVSSGLNHTTPKISYSQSIDISKDISRDKLFIRTIGWPIHYPTRYVHVWRFHARRGYAVKITFNKIFDVEYDGRSHSCFDDYVEIDDYEDRLRFCGYNRPESYTSKSYHGFTLTFRSDRFKTGRGFFATVEQVVAVKPKLTLMFANGNELGSKVSLKKGKYQVYAHVKGGISTGYVFSSRCVVKRQEEEESEEMIFDESEANFSMVDGSDDTVSMSVAHSKYQTFPGFVLIMAGGKKSDKICTIRARNGFSTYSTSIAFHTIN